MSLFGFIKRKKKKSIDKDAFYYHEDFYLQIEIIPRENFDFASSESKKITEFGESHKEGLGFTDIYERKDNKYKTIDKKVNPSPIFNALESAGLERIKKIQTGYSTHIEDCNSTIGYGNKNFAILIDLESEYVKDIYLMQYQLNDNDLELLSSGLIAIGKELDFIIVDWELSKIIDLKSSAQVISYVRGEETNESQIQINLSNDSNDFNKIATILTDKVGIRFSEQLNGLDQKYWDFEWKRQSN
ncbi:hypothetical protein GM418_25545 [Maribellus comscasis]|uniref:Uncharacterized protein n=1 Tax=Maribellus comscasis TaxID=2681766 RepID=A0A6I6K0D5_9BACT|nr:hypothetical protein [Maribellus comscasis]QGY46900.1 hypothetical protein GM418_25545 [Maribellus comscasis]